MQYAPVLLFAYNRLKHTKSTIDSLKRNPEAALTELYVFSDGAKDDNDVLKVEELRKYLHDIVGFKQVNLIFRESNYGLAKNIQGGITQIIDKTEKVIVLEDDLVLSASFLKYMNYALEFYKDKKNVWHISGWNYPIQFKSDEDAFFLRIMNCWGWATWKDRWSYFEKEPANIVKSWSNKDIKRFNLDNRYNFFKQIKWNNTGKIDTWAVFWYATIFKYDGVCLNPSVSLVENAGLDGSGENCSSFDIFYSALSQKETFNLPEEIEENVSAVSLIKRFYLRYTLLFPLRVVEKIKTQIYKSFS